jgi:hypothetical protein
MTETLEHTARRIAERGRDTLVARLRPAFAEAAAAHTDVLDLDAERIEQMVQRAADRADGLQWRRALAAVATEELGISLGEALGHPAVARAQAIVGAPSYEESLAAIAPPGPAAPAEPPTDQDEDQHQRADDERSEPEPQPQPEAGAHPSDVEPSPDDTQEHEYVPDATDELDEAEDDDGLDAIISARDVALEAIRLAAVHLSGVPELAAGEPELELRFSMHGLALRRESDEANLVHIPWEKLRGLGVQPAKTRLMRRRTAGARLIVRTREGEVVFEISGITPEDLRRTLRPALARL